MQTELHSSLSGFEESLRQLLLEPNGDAQIRLAERLVQIESSITQQLEALLAQRSKFRTPVDPTVRNADALVEAIETSLQLHDLLDVSLRKYPEHNGRLNRLRGG